MAWMSLSLRTSFHAESLKLVAFAKSARMNFSDNMFDFVDRIKAVLSNDRVQVGAHRIAEQILGETNLEPETIELVHKISVVVYRQATIDAVEIIANGE